MMHRFPVLTFQRGIAYFDGKPHLLISADYPYYRDEADNWIDRLKMLKMLGIGVITAYLPWRHHQLSPDSPPDFTGRSSPNRDVQSFLEHCRQLGLMVILKPGPFVHAELNYGGLPDWVCPLQNANIEPLRNADGQPQTWGGARLTPEGRLEPWPLPAPLSPEFLRLSQEWLSLVGEQVIGPHLAPNGPIIAVQLGNEGLYSNGQHAPWEYDYSTSALNRYHAFLQTKYTSLEAYNRWHASAFDRWEAIQPPRPSTLRREAQPSQLQDWGEFQAVYFNEILRHWQMALGVDVPILLNQNPPLDAPYGLDAWLTRVEPERWLGFHYGFTDWVGDVSANPSAFHRYVLTAKRFPGPNMEENWGFSQLYDSAYQDAATCFYQTLVALNSGATGFNVYTGVGTAHADSNLDLIHGSAYPDTAPITPDGLLTPKAEIVGWLAKFFERHGGEFLACRPMQPVAWGLYLPHVRLSAWSPKNDSQAPQHGKYLGAFQEQMRRLHLEYAVLNLERATAADLLTYRFLFLAGGKQMAESVQAKLVEYVCQGGRLVFLERIPRLDEQGRPCELLWQRRSALTNLPEGGFEALLADLPRPSFQFGRADIWIRTHPERDVHFVTVLIPADGETTLAVRLLLGNRWHSLHLAAARSGGALLRVENGRVTDCLLKGVNTYLGTLVAPYCRFDDQTISLDQPGDLLRLREIGFFLTPTVLALEKDQP
ncbi:MAG: beta-galactosidase [Anaerolineales bacterium]|nr:beta-galactosidase [Anaerolineales bacterium]MCX7607700.1 beta-galactosidase [Anaerolineales bacterium]MDW8227149.1 beta-galactosidase [Anaerolineales bacterium]